MEAKEIFKSMENAPAILAKYGFCAFEFGKTVNLPIDGVNTEVAIFWPYEDTGIFPKLLDGLQALIETATELLNITNEIKYIHS